MYRVAKVALVAMVIGLASTMAACGRIGELKAKRAFKDANVAYGKQDYKKAVEGYQAALAANPALTTAYFYLGNAYDNLYKPAKAGDPANDKNLEEAINYYNMAYERGTDPKMRKLSLDFLAEVYSNKQVDPEKAEPVLHKIIELDPKDPTGYVLLSNLKYEMGDYEAAEAELIRARDAKPEDGAIYARLADFYDKQGDFEKAIGSLRERAVKDPENPQAHYAIAQNYWQKAYKDFNLNDAQKLEFANMGLAAADQALKLDPNYVEAYTFRGLLMRVQASVEKDAAKKATLIKEAEAMTEKALDLRKAKTAPTATK